MRPASGPIEIDGRLDDAGWRDAADIPLAWEITPGDNAPPHVRTVCHVTFDSDALFVGCRAFDPKPDLIRAHLIERDNAAGVAADDLIGLYVDPFNDQRRAFMFIVNPLGVQLDGVHSTSQGEDYSWDAIWSSAGRITPEGFEVELAIPFKSLRFPRSDEVQTWGFLLVRAWPRDHRYRMQASPLDRRNSCYICQTNKLTGFQGISPGRNLEIAPTLTGQRTDVRNPFPDGRIVKGDPSAKLGGDLRWGVSPNVSLNATFRPDFSQVEADVAQLEVNKRYALYYPEKRPFFLEGADFFHTPVQAVFTRTVADPDAGLKLTGKVGASANNAIGVFAARDRLTNLIFPSNQGSDAAFLDRDSWTAVGRFRRDLGAASYLGLLYAGRAGAEYLNQTGGADLYYQLGPSTRIRAQYLASLTEYPDSLATAHQQPLGRFSGGALSLRVDYATARWRASAQYLDLSPGFRADVGFVPRVDTRTLSLDFAPQLRRRTGWYSYLAIGPFASQTRDHGGELTDQDVGLSLTYEGPLQTRVGGQLTNHRERHLGVLYTLNRATGYVDLKPVAGFGATLQWQIGDAIDYTNARQATEITLTPSVRLGLGTRLAIDLSDTYQRLGRQGREIFTANILQSKIAYNLDVRTLARLILQYRTVDRNPAEYLDPIDRSETGLFGQFLFAYQVNPQAVFFLGYSESGLGTQSYDLTRSSRTIFVKVGYGWRP